MSYSPFRHLSSVVWKDQPIMLTFFVTKRCNAKCSFCFYVPDTERENEISRELTLEQIKKMSGSMGNLLWLAFSGGEIFLRDDLVEIVKAFYDNNKPAIILLPTNGLLTDRIKNNMEKILEYCKNSTVVVKLSIDGPEDLHDSLRGVKGAFKKTIKTYEALAELLKKHTNFELGINTVFCAANQDYMDDTIKFVKGLNGLNGLNNHTVSLVRGSISDESLKDVDTDKYDRIIRQMQLDLRKKITGRYRFRGATLKAAQDILQRRLIYETFTQQKRLIKCFAGKLTLVLTESGDVYPCETLNDDSDRMKMGNVKEAGCDMAGLLKTEKAGNVIKTIKKDNCYCTHECYFIINILFNPLVYPSLAKEYIRL